jgi:hypothetical protein
MRADEEFVADAVAASFSGTWKRVPKDPPDIILSIDGRNVAVEISTLAEQIPAGPNRLQPRRSIDSAAIALCERLNASLASKLPACMTVILILEVPLKKFSKCEVQLRKYIELGAAEIRDREEHVGVLGNIVRIHYSLVPNQSDKKVVGIVANTLTNTHILDNTRVALGYRLEEKAKSCNGIVYEPLWLALLHDYWLASPETVIKAMGNITILHPFQKVLLVMGNGDVRCIYESRK